MVCISRYIEEIKNNMLTEEDIENISRYMNLKLSKAKYLMTTEPLQFKLFKDTLAKLHYIVEENYPEYE